MLERTHGSVREQSSFHIVTLEEVLLWQLEPLFLSPFLHMQLLQESLQK